MTDKSNRKKIVLRTGASLSALVTVLAAPTALASPQDGQVVRGDAAIFGEGTKAVTIDQRSDRAVINWDDFSIGADEAVTFVQPGARSVTVNRITGQNPSQIMGSLTANGQVVLINRNGIAFGENSRVDVAGLVASTADIDDDAFMAGGNTLRFDSAEPTMADIVVNGSISVKDAGLAAFVAPHVRNDGVIVASMGRVALGAGTGFAVDLYGDGLISFAPGDEISAALAGDSVAALVENSGQILAEGGKVLLTAAAARDVVRSSVNVSGLVSAASATRDGGTILLTGPGRIEVSGEGAVDVSSDATKGGTVKLLGETVALLDNAAVDATGLTGGGEVLVGGNYLGQGPESNATFNLMAPDAIINASATGNGNGGRVILWSDTYTNAWGTILARGGATGGDGGFVETSSKGELNMVGSVDAGASLGEGGTWLLDPGSIWIADSGASGTSFYTNTSNYTPSGDSTILASNIGIALNSNNVIIQTGTGGNYLIQQNASISWNSSYSLTMKAAGQIATTKNIINSGTGSINLRAGQDYANSDLFIAGGATIQTNGGDINLWQGRDDSGSSNTNSGKIIINGAIKSNGGKIGIMNNYYGGNVRGVEIKGSVLDAGNGNIYIDAYGKYVLPDNDSYEALLINGTTIKGNIVQIVANSQGDGANRAGIVLQGTVDIQAKDRLTLNGTAKGGGGSAAYAGMGIATHPNYVNNVTLYGGNRVELVGSTTYANADAINFSLSSGYNTVRIGYTNSGLLTSQVINIVGTGTGDINLGAGTTIRSNHADLMIGNDYNNLNVVSLGTAAIDKNYTFGKIYLGGLKVSTVLLNTPYAYEMNAEDSINIVTSGYNSINAPITNVGTGDINIYAAQTQEGDLSISRDINTYGGDIKLYGGSRLAHSPILDIGRVSL